MISIFIKILDLQKSKGLTEYTKILFETYPSHKTIFFEDLMKQRKFLN